MAPTTSSLPCLDQLVVDRRRRHVHAGVSVEIFGGYIVGERFQKRDDVHRARLQSNVWEESGQQINDFGEEGVSFRHKGRRYDLSL